MDFSPFAQVVEGMDVVDRIFKIGEKPDQGRIQAEGNKYLKKEFPRLTCVSPSLPFARSPPTPRALAAGSRAPLWSTAASCSGINVPRPPHVLYPHTVTSGTHLCLLEESVLPGTGPRAEDWRKVH